MATKGARSNTGPANKGNRLMESKAGGGKTATTGRGGTNAKGAKTPKK